MPETEVVSDVFERSLTIVRVFDAPRELVWKAWTDPEQFACWAGCDGRSVPLSTIKMDLRPGGAFSWVMVDDITGVEMPAEGVYREVVEPERLVSVWTFSDPLPEESVVTLTFTDLAGKTEMRMKQVGWTWGDLEAGLHDTRAGMGEEIDKLAKYLAEKT
jgi:uncharacterized protein YndB with AHSA1/START domain